LGPLERRVSRLLMPYETCAKLGLGREGWNGFGERKGHAAGTPWRLIGWRVSLSSGIR